jgi:S2P endopeptidase
MAALNTLLSVAIPLHSVGAYMTVAIPAAFVTLSSDTMGSIAPRNKLRVIAAGAFHNLLFYVLLFGMSWIGLGAALLALGGFKDVSSVGLAVNAVEEVWAFCT